MFMCNVFFGVLIIVGCKCFDEFVLGVIIVNNKIFNVCVFGGVEIVEMICVKIVEFFGIVLIVVFLSLIGVIGWIFFVDVIFVGLFVVVFVLVVGFIFFVVEGIVMMDLYLKI